MLLAFIVLGTLVAGIGSVWLAALLNYVLMARWAPHLLSLAAGALLSTAFMHLLPEAFESHANAQPMFVVLLAGLVFFFLLDKAELWHHGHEHHHGPAGEGGHAHGHAHSHASADSHAHSHSAHTHAAHEHEAPAPRRTAGAWAVLAGDSVHCFGDGILIASAFTADLRLGLVAALAVLTHEIPHHMGDLAVLRQMGGDRRPALVKVTLAGAVTTLGGLVGYWLVEALDRFLPYFLVVASSSFIYVALADLIPQLQKRLSARQTLVQVGWLVLGIVLVWGVGHLAHEH